MKILVCGNRTEQEWPEACVRALEAQGHETELCYYLWPRDGQFEAFLPGAWREDVPQLLDTEVGRKALMEALFYNLAAEYRPDLILLTGLASSWSADALADVQEQLGVPVVLWVGDEPFELDRQDINVQGPSRASFYDHVWFATPGPDGLEQGTAAGLERVGYLPFACDPERDQAPSDPTALAAYRCGLSYRGTLSPERAALLEALARTQADLAVWGGDGPENLEEIYPELSRARRSEFVDGREALLVYGGSKIVLNLHALGFANQAFFQAAACGAFQICNQRLAVEAAGSVLPLARQVVAFQEPGELAGLLQRYLNDEGERRRQAAELRQAVHAEHTWAHRTDAILRASLPSITPMAPVPLPNSLSRDGAVAPLPQAKGSGLRIAINR